MLKLNLSVFAHPLESIGDIQRQQRLGLAIIFGGALLIGGFTADYFISNRINVELSLFPTLEEYNGIGGGFKYYFKSLKKQIKWHPFIGAQISDINTDLDYGIGNSPRDDVLVVYFPIGIHYMGWKGF